MPTDEITQLQDNWHEMIEREYGIIQLDPHEATIAVDLITHQMKIVRLQLRRVCEDLIIGVQKSHHVDEVTSKAGLDGRDMRKDMEAFKEAMNSLHQENIKLFADIEFLIYSIRQLGRFFWMIVENLPKEPELKHLIDQYHEFLGEARDIRDWLAHIDDQIRDGISDLGNLFGTKFTFNGKEFDIGSELESVLEKFYEELMSACRSIAKRQRAKANP